MTVTGVNSGAGGAAAVAELEPQLERSRVELTGYCYRMLGSSSEAEDAVQETLVRAWRAYDRFEGRSSLRTWLYRIATNVCHDMATGRQRRARPVDLAPASTTEAALTTRPESVWLEPIPDGHVLSDGDPAEVAVGRETIRLAFVAALQHLPPRQRAVLILREVLRWRAAEVADLLDTTVASVNSALQRARATLATVDLTSVGDPLDEVDVDLLERYLDAFERYDMTALTALLREDAVMSMPPYELWLQGKDDVLRWLTGPGAGCRGSRMLRAGSANGEAAFGQYRPPATPGAPYRPWGLQVLHVHDGRIAGLTTFLDTDRLFPLFGLPPELPPERDAPTDR
jgi:RNA polymerase sigma-70 factor, ECF subfamily